MSLKIPLSLPPGPAQQAFIDHFNSSLREVLASSSGSAGFQPDGSFQTTTSGPAQFGDRTVHLAWILTKEPDGRLVSIEIMAAADTQDEWWHTPAHGLVSSALADALSDRKTRFFARAQVHYVGPALDGEYWLPGFRFAPALSDDSHPTVMNAERVVYIDFNVDAIDRHHMWALAGEVSARHASRLALVLDVAFYRPEQAFKWVLPERDGQPIPESRRFYLGFVYPGPPQTDMPEKGELCKLGRYAGSILDPYSHAGNLLTCPVELRRILRAADSGNMPFTEAFDACSRLYHLGLLVAQHSVSAGLAYRVASIDAIAQVHTEYAGPSDFIRRHTSAPPELNGLLDFLYSDVRSAHFHGGRLPLDNRAMIPFHPLLNSEYVRQSHLMRAGYSITRAAIVNWMLNALPTVHTEIQPDPGDAPEA